MIQKLCKIQFWKKLFAIRFPYKHCNFWPLCLPVKMASKTVIRPIDSGCWLPSFCYRPRQSFEMGNAIFLRNRNYRHEQLCWLPPHVLSKMMTRSKTWAILDKNRTNAWLDNMISNNSVVNEWKENFRLSQPTPSLVSPHLFLFVEATNSLLTNFILKVPGVVTMCKRSGVRISLQCKRQRFRILWN